VSLRTDRPVTGAAISGAAVWLLYGALEAVVLTSIAVAKNGLAAAAPGLHVAANPDFFSVAMGAAALIAYPIIGAAICAAIALVLSLSPAGRRMLAGGHAEGFFLAVAVLTVVLAFTARAQVTRPDIVPALLVPLGLAIAFVAAACRPTARRLRVMHPFWILLVLIGAAVLAARPIGPRLSVGLALAWAAIVALAATRWTPAAVPGSVLTAGVAAVLLTATPLTRVPELRMDTHAQPPQADPRPNVILIVLDTVRADHLSVYGYARDTTPRLRALAARATVYSHAIAPSNWTLPSVASMLTGQTPWHHGAEMSMTHPEGRGISPDSVLLPEMLAASGYATAGIVANGVLDPEFGFARGASSYAVVPMESVLSPLSQSFLLRSALRDIAAATLPWAPPDDSTANAGSINRRAIPALRSLAAGRGPFSLFLDYMDAHAPYTPPPPFDTRYAGAHVAFDWDAWGTRTPTSREHDYAVSQYDGAIAYLDQEVGQIFDTLDALGRFDNSLVIVIGDHGESFDDHGVIGHGRSLYDEQVHVPLIVKYPHAAAATRIDLPVTGLDIVPTVLEAAGLPQRRDGDGRSLRHTDAGDARWIVSESSMSRGFVPRDPSGMPAEVALTVGDMKLIMSAEHEDELYDRAADPGERKNLFTRGTVPAAWLSTLDEYRLRPLQSNAFVIDEALRRRLRALGYAGGRSPRDVMR
jgi:arylsulfatase A-like enzyme